MAQYHSVFPDFWADTATWTDDERLCGLYLLTSAHRRTEGLYRLPTAYASHDMAWPADRFDAAVKALADRGWVVREGDWVLLVNGLRWNAPANPNQAKGARNHVSSVPRDSTVYRTFYEQAETFCPALAELLDKPLRRGFEAPSKGCNSPFETSTPTQSLSPTQSQGPPAAETATTTTGPDPVEVVPPASLPPHIDDAARLLDEGGVVLLDAHQLLALHLQHPTVDMVEVARRAVRSHRNGGIRGNKLGYIRAIVTSDDAPKLTAAATQGLPAFEQAVEAVDRKVGIHRKNLRRVLRDLSREMPAAAALLMATEWDDWHTLNRQSFEGRQWRISTRKLYEGLTVDDVAIQRRIAELEAIGKRQAELNGVEYVA